MRIRDVTEWTGTAGDAGERYSAHELARSLCVRRETVQLWIRKRWLRASVTVNRGYRIRRRAVRRLLADYPSAADVVMRAQLRYWKRWHRDNPGR